MSKILSLLRNDLLTYPAQDDISPSHPQSLSVFNSIKPQQFHHVPFSQATMLMVVNGHKQAKLNDNSILASAGDMLLIPPDTSLWIGNYPDEQKQRYLGLAFRFDHTAIRLFKQTYGSSLDSWETTPIWHASAPDNIMTTLHLWIEWYNHYPSEPQLSQHRQVELLLLLAQSGLIGNILLGEHPSWRQRVTQLLSIDPAQAWQINEVCTHLGVSESSLRRKLQEEQSNFRDLLEEVRLATGLSLLLETMRSIGQVADAVGYQSQSRFGERFKRRFGMTPSELRKTRPD